MKENVDETELENSAFGGYYPTTDGDGKPFIIAYISGACFDAIMPYGMSCP
jgi:hypothetical protein